MTRRRRVLLAANISGMVASLCFGVLYLVFAAGTSLHAPLEKFSRAMAASGPDGDLIAQAHMLLRNVEMSQTVGKALLVCTLIFVLVTILLFGMNIIILRRDDREN